MSVVHGTRGLSSILRDRPSVALNVLKPLGAFRLVRIGLHQTHPRGAYAVLDGHLWQNLYGPPQALQDLLGAFTGLVVAVRSVVRQENLPVAVRQLPKLSGVIFERLVTVLDEVD